MIIEIVMPRQILIHCLKIECSTLNSLPDACFCAEKGSIIYLVCSEQQILISNGKSKVKLDF